MTVPRAGFSRGRVSSLRTDTAVRWVERLAPLGVVSSEVETLQQALNSDLTRSRGLVVRLGQPEDGLRAIGLPLKIDGFSPRYGLPPLLNQHHDELLGNAQL